MIRTYPRAPRYPREIASHALITAELFQVFGCFSIARPSVVITLRQGFG
jgi:hypothetical protein